ncbi:hypothetical protein NDU88_002332 [Pleurodeles waltl]|uniref:Uncharacterized protein n=1 Tax=Pleurodeles waltl TaxID=8319 RepID=A0AAV7KTV4_PLEWA|nr:hypothetical protein NDU88_002332 [Pleurodeles waltl]
MILIVETARELMEALTKEIQTLEDELKVQDTLQEAKKQLEAVSQELESFNLYLIKRKTDKLRKDTRWFSRERAYPYRSEKYYQSQHQNGPEQDRQFWTSKKIVTFSNTSESDGDGKSNQFDQYHNRTRQMRDRTAPTIFYREEERTGPDSGISREGDITIQTTLNMYYRHEDNNNGGIECNSSI